MNKIFNLTEFVKEAMGYRPWRHRLTEGSELMWFDMEDINEGSNKAWLRWVAEFPTLKTVETECRAFYNDKMKTFRDKYGLSPKEITNFFKLWIGYNPDFGAYMFSVGPYCYGGGGKEAQTNADLSNIDQNNRFLFFMRRFQYADAATIDAAYQKFVSDKLGVYADIFDKSDFDFDIKKANGLKENGKIDWETVVVGMDDPAMETIINDRHVFLGAGSQTNLNAKGLGKLIMGVVQRESCPDILAQLITHVAARRKIDPSQIEAMLQTGEGDNALAVLKEVFDTMQNFFPVLVKRQARNNGWEDILNQAVSQLAGKTITDANGQRITLGEEQVWQLLGQNVSGDENAPVLQPIQYSNRAQTVKSNDIRDSLLKELVQNISEIKHEIAVANRISPNDPPEVASQKQQQLDKINRIAPLPVNNDIGKSTSGAQRPTAAGPKPAHFRLLALKKEILEYLVGQDPNNINYAEIARAMTEKRQRSRTIAQGGEWTTEDVNRWVDNILEELSQSSQTGAQKDFSTLLQETDRDLAKVRDGMVRGTVEDFQSALSIGRLTFMGASYEELDPLTRTPKNINFNSLAPIFYANEGAPNVTSAQLTEIRNAHSQGQETSVDGEVEKPNVATQSDIEKQIGETPEINPSAPQTPSVTEPVSDTPVSMPATSTPETPDFDEEELEREHLERQRKYLKNTLNTLIKIASELDDAGKIEAAEEIHLIIRKYLG